jgi:hypothetical protein
MSSLTLFAIAGTLVVTTINIVASLRLVRAPWFSTGQKLAQLLFLWFLPILGFAFVWHFINEMAPPKVTTDLRSWLESDDTARRLSNVQREENIHTIEHGRSD